MELFEMGDCCYTDYAIADLDMALALRLLNKQSSPQNTDSYPDENLILLFTSQYIHEIV